MSYFSNKLRELRECRDLSQEKLADDLGVSKSTIGMYERGHREPNFEMLEAIADYFNVDMNCLTGKKPTVNDDELSPEEWEVIKKFRQSSDEIKNAVRRIVDIGHE